MVTGFALSLSVPVTTDRAGRFMTALPRRLESSDQDQLNYQAHDVIAEGLPYHKGRLLVKFLLFLS